MSTYLKPHRQRDDTGFTLIEMVIAMSIMSLVVAITTAGLSQAERLFSSNADRLDGVTQSKVAIEAMTKTIRTAVEPRLLGDPCDTCLAFIEGDATSMTFKAALSTMRPPSGNEATRYGPAKVTYRLVGSELEETYQLPEVHLPTAPYTYCSVGAVGCDARVRTLATDLVAGQVFTYYDSSTNSLPLPLQNSQERLAAVDSIDIVLTTQVSNRVEASTLVSRVSLVNAGSEPTPSPSPGG